MARTAAPKAKPSSLLEKFKDFEGIKVAERRLSQPDQPGSLPIRLKDEPSQLEDPQGLKRIWYLRWVNGGQEGRYAQITDGMGYVPVRVSELQNRDAITGIFRDKDDTDPIVRRGDRGQEVLVKMPLELYNEIKRRQQEMRTRRGNNAKRVKADLADLAGAQLGDEAGETIAKGFSVEMRQRKSTLGAEIAGGQDFDEDRA
jgi:hypothetical protein